MITHYLCLAVCCLLIAIAQRSLFTAGGTALRFARNCCARVRTTRLPLGLETHTYSRIKSICDTAQICQRVSFVTWRLEQADVLLRGFEPARELLLRVS